MLFKYFQKYIFIALKPNICLNLKEIKGVSFCERKVRRKKFYAILRGLLDAVIQLIQTIDNQFHGIVKLAPNFIGRK